MEQILLAALLAAFLYGRFRILLQWKITYLTREWLVRKMKSERWFNK
ncbi:hypothetical protein [Peribacillus simplex]|nr:hypothetical protein [Peribacillus simplex]